MVGLGTRFAIERAEIGNSRPKTARASALPDEREAQQFASLALGRLRRKLPALELAFTGQCTEHHGRLMALALELIALLERQSAALDEQMRLLVEPLLPQIEQLDSMPGGDAIAAR